MQVFTEQVNAAKAFSESLFGILSLEFKGERDAVIDAFLFHSDDGPAIISAHEVDMEEVAG